MTTPTLRIVRVTPDLLRAEFPNGLRCGRCSRELRVLDSMVQYPTGIHPLLGAVICMAICEPCLDREIAQANWTPPEGV